MSLDPKHPVPSQAHAATSDPSPSPRRRAALQALFVTFLWSTSWVLIKIGLDDIPAITFAGLRYTVAFVILAPLALRPRFRRELRAMTAGTLAKLAGLGLLLYTLTQGAQFLGLVYLPATTASLLLSFTPLLVALLGVVALREVPTLLQGVGTAVYLIGAWIYLQPSGLAGTAWLGFGIVAFGVLCNAGAAVAGRGFQRNRSVSPLAMTWVSMGVGSMVLLAVGVSVDGIPTLDARSWAIVVWLAAVNTAFAFTLWNATMRVLPALTSSLINNTMLVQIAALAWIFLGESLGAREVSGLLLAVTGILVTQLSRRRPDHSR